MEKEYTNYIDYVLARYLRELSFDNDTIIKILNGR